MLAPMGAQCPWGLSAHGSSAPMGAVSAHCGRLAPMGTEFSGKWLFNFILTSNFVGASGFSAHTAPTSTHTAPTQPLWAPTMGAQLPRQCFNIIFVGAGGR